MILLKIECRVDSLASHAPAAPLVDNWPPRVHLYARVSIWKSLYIDFHKTEATRRVQWPTRRVHHLKSRVRQGKVKNRETSDQLVELMAYSSSPFGINIFSKHESRPKLCLVFRTFWISSIGVTVHEIWPKTWRGVKLSNNILLSSKSKIQASNR